MIRLYVDSSFEKGERIQLPADEIRYFKSVRRGQGEVCLFNRANQIAHGNIEGKFFTIEKVERVELPAYNITLAMALPEASVLALAVRSLSELGVKKLILFAGERSQKAASRLKDLERLEKISVEAARQCGRGCPLEVEVVEGGFSAVSKIPAHEKIFFDEATESFQKISFASDQNILLAVGCEGGWTQRERDEARSKHFTFVHFKTPILRVETAAICAAFFAIENTQI